MTGEKSGVLPSFSRFEINDLSVRLQEEEEDLPKLGCPGLGPQTTNCRSVLKFIAGWETYSKILSKENEWKSELAFPFLFFSCSIFGFGENNN